MYYKTVSSSGECSSPVTDLVEVDTGEVSYQQLQPQTQEPPAAIRILMDRDPTYDYY